MSKVKPAGRVDGYATLEIIKGFSFLKVNAQVFKSSTKENDPTKLSVEGNTESLGMFDGDILPEQKTVLGIGYNTTAGTYWQADREILNYIVDNLKLRFPANHPDTPLKIIKPEDVNPLDYNDFFFDQFKNDKRFRRVMKGGVYTFKLDDHVDRLYFYLYLHSPITQVEGEEVSKYMTGRLKYKLVLPDVLEKRKVEVEDKDIESISLLGKKNGISFDKQKLIAQIMNVKEINQFNPDPENLRVQLKLQVATNKKPSSVMKGLTIQDWFQKLAEATPSNLQKEAYVHKGLKYNILVRNGDRFRFNEEPIESVESIRQLVEYFSDKENTNRLGELTDLVDSRDTQLAPKNVSIGQEVD